jgi:hypothetical protein
MRKGKPLVNAFRWRRPDPLCPEARAAVSLLAEYPTLGLSPWTVVFWAEIARERGKQHAREYLDLLCNLVADHVVAERHRQP